MSGHSKWHQIKHKKAQTDGQKSRRFGRLARDIQIAARAGTDPTTNAALREAIARAKKANMPQDNIDRLRFAGVWLLYTLHLRSTLMCTRLPLI